MTVGEKIKQFVEQHIPDKQDYKEYLGMSYGGMHKYFTDQRKPGFDVLRRLQKLGMNINDLIKTGSYAMPKCGSQDAAGSIAADKPSKSQKYNPKSKK